jgi:ubiquinone/menaquinone biosynthesis C-methylase UbiE
MIERIPGPFAAIYEKAARMVVGTYYSHVADEVVSSLKEGLILDLGTGPGYLPIEIVKRNKLIRCDGIDLSRRLIRLARKNAVKAGVADRLRFEVGNAAKLKFDDGSYDMILSTGMLHTLKDPVKVLRECHRLLKESGQAWIFDPAKISSFIDREKWKTSLTSGENLIFRLFPLYRRINPSKTYHPEQVIAMVRASGFEDYEVREQESELRIKLRK